MSEVRCKGSVERQEDRTLKAQPSLVETELSWGPDDTLQQALGFTPSVSALCCLGHPLPVSPALLLLTNSVRCFLFNSPFK